MNDWFISCLSIGRIVFSNGTWLIDCIVQILHVISSTQFIALSHNGTFLTLNSPSVFNWFLESLGFIMLLFLQCKFWLINKHYIVEALFHFYDIGHSNLRYRASVDGDSNLSSITDVYILMLISEHFRIQQSSGKTGIWDKTYRLSNYSL